MIPHFTSPVLNVIPAKISQNIKAEFFYYSHSTGEEYAVYISQGFGIPHIQFDFFKTNGSHVYWKKLTIDGLKDEEYQDVSIKISLNGKYIYLEARSSNKCNKNLIII